MQLYKATALTALLLIVALAAGYAGSEPAAEGRVAAVTSAEQR